ncbi:hypothetical protein TNCV_1176871 [Trichonephila clavipes]|nr:hypothetical protein TNCV_1176871 [Trichonephila clavipes]
MRVVKATKTSRSPTSQGSGNPRLRQMHLCTLPYTTTRVGTSWREFFCIDCSEPTVLTFFAVSSKSVTIPYVQSHWDSEAWKTRAEMGRFSGIRLRDYKRENLENKSKQEVTMEESPKKGT